MPDTFSTSWRVLRSTQFYTSRGHYPTRVDVTSAVSRLRLIQVRHFLHEAGQSPTRSSGRADHGVRWS